jgi:hypothetical protein
VARILRSFTGNRMRLPVYRWFDQWLPVALIPFTGQALFCPMCSNNFMPSYLALATKTRYVGQSCVPAGFSQPLRSRAPHPHADFTRPLS